MRAIAFILLTSCAGASANAGTPAQQAELAAFQAEGAECVTMNAMRIDAEQCWAKVQARWCGPGEPLYDAGACFFDAGAVVVLEGGGQ